MSSRLTTIALAFASGGLAALCFLTPSAAVLSLVALAPLLCAVAAADADSPTAVLRAFGLGWMMGIVGIATAFAWALATIARFEHASIPWALPFFILFVGYYALQFGLFAAGVAWLSRGQLAVALSHKRRHLVASGIVSQGLDEGVITSPQPSPGRRGSTMVPSPAGEQERYRSARLLSHAPGGPVLLAALTGAWWVLLEWSFPKIVPWFLADALANAPLLRQAADVGGVHGLSFLIVFINACVATAIDGRGQPRPRLTAVVAALAVIGLWAAYGAVQLRRYEPSFEGDRVGGRFGSTHQAGLSITIVQGNLVSGRADLDQANQEAWEIYAQLSRSIGRPSALGGMNDTEQVAGDLLVWPETVLRLYLRNDPRYRAHVTDLTAALAMPLLLGSLDLPAHGVGEFNATYLVSATGRGIGPGDGALQIYRKQRLLPFGEFVPGATWLPWMASWETTGRFVRNDDNDPALLTLPRSGYAFAPSICFEAIWPGTFNQAVRAGAAFLVNVTDDGWFGDTAAPHQHLRAATLRAVETRRWLVRASNSGVSAFVDPTGAIVRQLPLGETGVLAERIQVSDALPLYVRFGDWVVGASLLLVVTATLRRRGIMWG